MGIRDTQVAVEVLDQPTTQRVRATQTAAEALVQPTTQRVRATQTAIEALVQETVLSRGHTSTATPATTSFVLNLPELREVGDLLLAQVAYRDVPTVTAPDGWDLALTVNHSDTTVGMQIYRRIVDGSEANTATWTLTTSKDVAGGISGYYGTTGVIEATSTAESIGGTVTAPSIETSVKVQHIITFYAAAQGGSNVWTEPTGFTENRDVGTTSGVTAGKSGKSHPGGSTGDKSASTGTSNSKVIALVGLRDLSASGFVTVVIV